MPDGELRDEEVTMHVLHLPRRLPPLATQAGHRDVAVPADTGRPRLPVSPAGESGLVPALPPTSAALPPSGLSTRSTGAPDVREPLPDRPIYAGPPTGPLVIAPTNSGDPVASGLRLGPAYILAQFELRDYNLLRPRLGAGTIEAVTAAVSLAVARAAARGQCPVVLGGDHAVALGGILGVYAGLAQRAKRRRTRRAKQRDEAGGVPALDPSAPPPLFVLWLDAHPDVNTA